MALLGFSSLLDYLQNRVEEENAERQVEGDANLNGMLGILNAPLNANQDIDLETIGICSLKLF